MKRVHVAGEATIRWSVLLPNDKAHEGVIVDDPAKECVIAGLSKSLNVYLWGEDEPPAGVYIECHEDDVTVEENDR